MSSRLCTAIQCGTSTPRMATAIGRADGGAVNGTFTFSVRGTGSDGSTFANHVTDHFNTTPNGAEFFFTNCHN